MAEMYATKRQQDLKSLLPPSPQWANCWSELLFGLSAYECPQFCIATSCNNNELSVATLSNDRWLSMATLRSDRWLSMATLSDDRWLSTATLSYDRWLSMALAMTDDCRRQLLAITDDCLRPSRRSKMCTKYRRLCFNLNAILVCCGVWQIAVLIMFGNLKIWISWVFFHKFVQC